MLFNGFDRLFLICLQRDFFPGGTVALHRAVDVLDIANDLIHSGYFDHIVATTLIHHPCHAYVDRLSVFWFTHGLFVILYVVSV